MAAKYVPYKGVFGGASKIEVTLDWFNYPSELDILWVFPSGDCNIKSMTTANMAGYASVSGKKVTVLPLKTDTESAEHVYIYRKASLMTQASVQVSGKVPVDAIVSELEELRRAAEDSKVEAQKAIRIPENSNFSTHLPSKEQRAGQIVGFDEDGNVAVGSNVPQIAELFDAQTSCDEAVKQAQAHAQTASDAASAAGMHAQNAMESIITASDHAEKARDYALTAEGWCQKTAEAGTSAVTRMDNLIWRAETAQTSAEAAADRAEAAIETIRFNNEELDKAIHYVACATEQVERDVETTRVASEEAVSSANNAAQSASVAKTSETNAKASETASKASETASANSASSASTSATNAANSASSASTSATNASNSATAAAESAEQAAQSAEALANVYTKPQIDGVSTGAEVTLKMNEIIAQLKDWEDVTGETLPNEFWEALMAEFQRWQDNPTEVKEWVTSKDAAGNITSTCPYYEDAPQTPIVDFNVVAAKCTEATASAFARSVVGVFLPSASGTMAYAFNKSTSVKVIIAPNVTGAASMLISSSVNMPVYLPSVLNIASLLYGNRQFNSKVFAPVATTWSSAFTDCSSYNQTTDMRSATTAPDAFRSTAMSPENIAATLDTLPEKTDGNAHTIKFSRYDGTLLAPLMAESPYVESVNTAVAKGWTVQFD